VFVRAWRGGFLAEVLIALSRLVVRRAEREGCRDRRAHNAATGSDSSVTGGGFNKSASSFDSVSGGCSNLAGAGSVSVNQICNDTTGTPTASPRQRRKHRYSAWARGLVSGGYLSEDSGRRVGSVWKAEPGKRHVSVDLAATRAHRKQLPNVPGYGPALLSQPPSCGTSFPP